MDDQIIGKELFKVMKQKMGGDFERFISEKVKMVAGDITCHDLNIQEASMKDEMFNNLDVIVNSAAKTNFDERYDVSLFINTYGAKNVMDFAKKCANLKVLVHISTAYVSGERGGLILEDSYKMGEALNGTHGLDIEEEKRVLERKVVELQAERADPDAFELAIKDFGIERAKKYGWPNVYVFTKALGEMMIMEHKECLPIVIIRPTIVTSTYKEPFPGWVEGMRTIDSIAVAYGKGRLTFFAGDPNSILDVIPGDMVVNATLVAMVAHASQLGECAIYQVGSSMRNPLKISTLRKVVCSYFITNPWIDKEGKPVIVGDWTVLDSMDNFYKYLSIHYLLPLKGLELVNTVFCQYFAVTYFALKRKISFVSRYINIYKPYLFFKGIFDDLNTEKLRTKAREGNVENDIFYFDPKEIDWEDYFMHTHFPGVVQYVRK